MENNESIFICAAIDFGTTYSGVAYSYRNDQDKVWTILNWPDGKVSAKVPTAILFDPAGDFLAFGNGAIDKYTELSEEEEEEDYYFFHRFKMELYDKIINRSLILEDIEGKKMEALKIFSESIRYLRNHLIFSLKKRGVEIETGCINWVLTVPAIWSDSSKHFMRTAAERAGIRSHNLVIALEPEAAAFFCFHTTENMVIGADISKDDMKYLVLDAGGGTLDIAAHKKFRKVKVNEIMKPSGGALGGTKVDSEFEKYMVKLFGNDSIAKVKKKHPTAWIQLIQDFEEMKKKVNPGNNDNVLSLRIQKEYFDIQYFDQLSQEDRDGAMRTKGSILKFKKDIIANMISSVSKQIAQHLYTLLRKDQLNDLDLIVMVGGFSNSTLVVDEVKKIADNNNIAVVVPEQAELSVMKGAVLFGWRPQIIGSRICRRTYGFETCQTFNAKHHSTKRKRIINGKNYCINIFVKLIEAGEEIEQGHFVQKKQSIIDTTRPSPIGLYATELPNVQYCDEESAYRVGVITLPPPKPKADGTISKEIEVKAYFGDTELKFEVTHLSTGETVTGNYNFLG